MEPVKPVLRVSIPGGDAVTSGWMRAVVPVVIFRTSNTIYCRLEYDPGDNKSKFYEQEKTHGKPRIHFVFARRNLHLVRSHRLVQPNVSRLYVWNCDYLAGI